MKSSPSHAQSRRSIIRSDGNSTLHLPSSLPSSVSSPFQRSASSHDSSPKSVNPRGIIMRFCVASGSCASNPILMHTESYGFSPGSTKPYETRSSALDLGP